jgi:DNA repair exonuclease SbcCD ATPase subunit
MREAIQDEMERELEAAEEAFPVVEDAKAMHFMEEFKPAQVTAAKLAELKAKYSGLQIVSVEDRKTYDLVHAGRMEVRGLRTAVDKTRKKLNEDHLEYMRAVNAEAKRITGLLLEIEEPLEAEEARIDAEREAIKQAKQREKEAELQRRIDALTAVGHPVTVGDLVTMPATTFAMVLQTATEAFQVREKERLAAEAALAEKRAEEERLAREQAEAKAAAEKAERERLAAERAKLDAEQAEFRRQQEEFQAQRRAQEQADRDKRIAEEAAARAKAEAERQAAEEAARKEREAKEAAEAATQAEARRQAAAAARPDADKLLGLAETLRGTAFPKLATAEGQKVITETALLVAKVVKYVEDKAAALSPKVMA